MPGLDAKYAILSSHTTHWRPPDSVFSAHRCGARAPDCHPPGTRSPLSVAPPDRQGLAKFRLRNQVETPRSLSSVSICLIQAAQRTNDRHHPPQPGNKCQVMGDMTLPRRGWRADGWLRLLQAPISELPFWFFGCNCSALVLVPA